MLKYGWSLTSRSCYSLNNYPALPRRCSWLPLHSVEAATQRLLESMLSRGECTVPFWLSTLTFPSLETHNMLGHVVAHVDASLGPHALCVHLRPPPHFNSGSAVRGKVYMADGCADLQQEARLAFHNLCRNEKRVATRPGLGSAPRCSRAARSLCNGCQLACGGYEHEAKGRVRLPARPPARLKWTPETS